MEGYLKLEHVSRMRWRAPYTGAHGTVPQADSSARDAIIGNLFETYPPAEPTTQPVAPSCACSSTRRSAVTR